MGQLQSIFKGYFNNDEKYITYLPEDLIQYILSPYLYYNSEEFKNLEEIMKIINKDFTFDKNLHITYKYEYYLEDKIKTKIKYLDLIPIEITEFYHNGKKKSAKFYYNDNDGHSHEMILEYRIGDDDIVENFIIY